MSGAATMAAQAGDMRARRRAALLDMIEDAVSRGAPLPFDPELAVRLGCNAWAVRTDMAALQRMGRISWVTMGSGGSAQRVVTLLTGSYEGRSTAARTGFHRGHHGSARLEQVRARAGEAPLPPVVIALTAQSGLKLGEASVPGDVWLRVAALAEARGVKAARLVPALIEAGLDARNQEQEASHAARG